MQDSALFTELAIGSVLTVGDGGVDLRVVDIAKDCAQIEVDHGGRIEPNRGLTVIGGADVADELTEADQHFIRDVVESSAFDVLAVSFVVGPAAVAEARSLCAGSGMPILAKIESSQGVENIDKIAVESDMLMAARGDLSLAIPWVETYAATKRIAEAALSLSKPWVLATQVLEGLSEFGFPTRAEMCDVPSWMDHGASGAMLSKETAFGARPIECIEALAAMCNAKLAW